MKKNNSKIITFLQESGVWEGSFTNFVNRKDGIIQKGKTRIKVVVDDNGVITIENAIFDEDGNPGPYTGMAKMRIKGNKLINLLEMTEDPNTDTKIENHQFQGFIGNNHVHILEEYDDVFPNGKIDHRRNSLHYYSVSENKLLMISDVYVNGELLVFVDTFVSKKE